jgi:hypothetical protein
MTSVVMPGLPLSQLNIQRYSPSEDIAAETGWVMGEIVDGLTTDPEQLREVFHEKFWGGSHKIGLLGGRGIMSVRPASFDSFDGRHSLGVFAGCHEASAPS